MIRKESPTIIIGRLVFNRFPSLLSTKGIDIEELVRFILAKRNALKSAKRKIGNDARDISFTSGLLMPLSNQDLGTIKHLKQRDIHKRLRSKASPFSRLSKETREKLLYLPISWVWEGAQWQLNSRKPVT